MAKTRLGRVLSRVVDLKPGEEVTAVLFFLYFFLVTAPYYIIKSLRNANYLEHQGVNFLPLAYFLTAVLMGFIVNFHSRLQAKIPRRTLFLSSLVFFLLTIFLFWWLFLHNWKWVPLVFWVWANIFAIVLVTQFWILVSDVFNPREAKRLIGFIGSGAQLGAILGGLMAGSLGKTKASDFLLLIAAGLLSIGIFIVLFIFSKRKKDETEREVEKRVRDSEKQARSGFRDAWETVKQSRYLKLLAGIMMITIVVSTLIDFQFNKIVDFRVKGGANLTSFFGYFNAGTMAVAFLLQLLLTSNIIKRFGISLTLLFYPLVLLFGSAGIGIWVFASLIPPVLIKASDKSLAYSLNQSVRELLYIPISVAQKYKSKIFIDMFVNRFAKGVGAVIIVIVLLIFKGAVVRALSVAVVLIILGWLYLNLKVGREYTNTVKDKIKPKWERGDWLVSQKLDVDYTKQVFDALETKDRSSVLYAMHVYDLIKQDKLTPEIKKLISYKQDEMRAASLGSLMEQSETGLGPQTDDQLGDEALKKEVEEIISLDSYQEVMKTYIDKTIAEGGEAGKIARMEAAKAIGLMAPDAPVVERLEDLLTDESPEVSHYAVASAAALKRRESVPTLVQKLSQPILREDARDALVKYGPKIVGTLADYLEDSAEDPEIRKAVSSVLASIGNQDAADFLGWQMAEAEGGLAADIIDGLDRIRSVNNQVHFPEEVIKSKISQEIVTYCRSLVTSSQELGEGERSEISGGRGAEQANTLENIFKLLGLIYPRPDISKAYQNLKTGTKDAVAYAIELLDNILDREMRESLFPLIEDLSVEDRMSKCQGLLASLAERKKPE